MSVRSNTASGYPRDLHVRKPQAIRQVNGRSGSQDEGGSLPGRRQLTQHAPFSLALHNTVSAHFRSYAGADNHSHTQLKRNDMKIEHISFD
jgi:hypothetical protein